MKPLGLPMENPFLSIDYICNSFAITTWIEINILVIFFSQEWITKLGVTSWRKIILHLIKWMHFILGYTGIFGKCVVFHSNFDWNKNSIPPKKQLEPVAALMRFLAYSSENSNETLTRKKHTFKYGQRNKHSDD